MTSKYPCFGCQKRPTCIHTELCMGMYDQVRITANSLYGVTQTNILEEPIFDIRLTCLIKERHLKKEIASKEDDNKPTTRKEHL